jgi:outer membrane autotransporter protein
MNGAGKLAVRLLVWCAMLLAPLAEGAELWRKGAGGIGIMAASGHAFEVSFTNNQLTGKVAIVGTQDAGGGQDAVIVRCRIFDAATGLVTQVGSPVSVSIPIGTQRDVPISCTFPATGVGAGSYVYVEVEQGGNPGKVIARSSNLTIGGAPSPGQMIFSAPFLAVTSVTKQGTGFLVDGEYFVSVSGAPALPLTAELGWYTTSSPQGSVTRLTSFPLTATGTQPGRYTGRFSVTIDPTGSPGFAGSVALVASLPNAPTVFANVSFPTLTSCTAAATPANPAAGQTVTLTVTCPSRVGPITVQWRDAAGAIVRSGNPITVIAGTSPSYTALVTDQVSPSISAQGIKLSVNVPVGAVETDFTPRTETAVTGVPGQEVQPPFQVRLTANNRPVQGQPITWTLTGGDGSFFPPNPSFTNLDGVAEMRFTLGADSSDRVVTATEPSGKTVTFRVSAAPPQVVVRQGGNQVGIPGQPLPQEIQVQVLSGGRPVNGQQVQFVIEPAGSGAVSPSSYITGPDGIARTSVTLGPQPGPRTVFAQVSGQAFPIHIRDAETAVLQPAAQVTTPQATVAISTPQIQLSNIQQRLDSLRMLRNPTIAQGLRLSYNGRPLPPLTAFALAPTASNGAEGQPTGGGASADQDPFERFGLFVQGDVDIGKAAASGNQSGFDVRSKGLTIGGDYRFPGNHILGAAIGFLRADADLNDGAGDQEAKGYSISLFGEWVPVENAYVDVAVNFGKNKYDSVRRTTDAVPLEFTSNPRGDQFGISVSGGYQFYRQALTLAPYGRIEYFDVKIDAFQESGAEDGALSVGSQRYKVTVLSIGGQASYAISTSWGVVVPYVRAEYQHQANTDAKDVSVQLLGTSLALSNLPTGLADKNYGNVSLGATVSTSPAFSGFFNYQRLLGKQDFDSDRFTLGLRYDF